MIDRFTRERFEAALPRLGPTNALWSYVGLINGEHCYAVPIRSGVLIFIRSSVNSNGIAADTAEDSIRCWLASDDKGKTLGSKHTAWITRVRGWEERLLKTLRVLWRLGNRLGLCACGGQLLALKVRKPGPNQGRWFSSCSICGQFGNWLHAIPVKTPAKASV